MSSAPSWGDWVRVVHDDDPAKPDEPYRDLVGLCGFYDGYDSRHGVPRPHRVQFSGKNWGLVYVFAVKVVTPKAAIDEAKCRCETARDAVLSSARAQHASSQLHAFDDVEYINATDATEDAVDELIAAEAALAALRPERLEGDTLVTEQRQERFDHP